MDTRKSNDTKKRIFMLSPGPCYNLEHKLKDRCEKLSHDFYGVVLTSGPSYSKQNYGSFRVICVRDPFVKSVVSTVLFMAMSFFYLLTGYMKKDPFSLFITYDPLKTGLVGAIVTAFYSTKLVVEVNGDYTQDIIYDTIKNPYKRKLKKWGMMTTERYVLKRADGIKLQFEKQIDSFMPLKKQPVISIFPNYVNADHFDNAGETKEVLFVGFPLKIKGVDILIPAYKKCANDFPDWKLKILGYYPDKTELDNLINGDDRVYHHPPVDSSEISKHMGQCGIFVIASRTEGVPRVLLESMAAGKPRIGSDVGGIPRVISHGEDGFIFMSEDIDDLAEKLRLLMADKKMRERFGLASSVRYREEFSNQQYFRKLTNLYTNTAEK